MASRFPGGGAEFYGGGRSISGNDPQQPYRSQLAGIFLDQAGQIPSRAVGPKRSLADFQGQQQFPNAALNALFLRSVKPRTLPHVPSPMSPFPPVPNDLSFLGSAAALSQRYGVPVIPQLRPQPMGNGLAFQMNNLNQNQNQNQNQPRSSFVEPVQPIQDTESMMNRLKELEKQLLDDDEGDAVSVITNVNSEWTETIQNLVTPRPSGSPSQNPVSSSSPSSSSSSSSSSIASPPSACSRQTLMEAATAISEGRNDVASEIISRASQSLNIKSNSEQRVMDFVLSGLKSRLNPTDVPAALRELYSKEHLGSMHLLYELSPCFKLGFMAANLAILEATLDQNNETGFHVIDFDIGQGGQYMNLLHELSARKIGVPAVVKITAVSDDAGERSKAVGDMLSQLGQRLGVRLKFNVVPIPRLSDLSRDSLGCEPDEPVAVNLAFKLYRVPDESVCTENPRDELLRRVKALTPRVVTLVEQDMNGNTAPFVARVGEACAYYGALFESVDSTVPKDNSDRVKVEEGLSRKITNSVASEGRERVERCEVFGKWRVRMGMAGFALVPLSQTIAESIRSRLGNGNRVHPGFTVKEDNGGVCFGWMGRTLTVASSWR